MPDLSKLTGDEQPPDDGENTTLRCRLMGHKPMPASRFISMEDGFGMKNVCRRAGCDHQEALV